MADGAVFLILMKVLRTLTFSLLIAYPAYSQTDEAREFKGIVAPARTYDIAPPVDGLVLKIHFVAGQHVRKGDLLFTLDSTRERLALERDEALLRKAEAEHRLAEATLERLSLLRKKSAVSEQDYREAEARRDIAAAMVTVAQVQVSGDEVVLNGMKRYAPFSGVMGQPTVAEGAHLIREARQQTTMATITELDPIMVRAFVPYDVYSSVLNLLNVNDGTSDRASALDRIEVSAFLPNGQRLPEMGRIAGGGYEFDPQTQVMEVMVEFPNPKLLLRPGLAVTLQGRLAP